MGSEFELIGGFFDAIYNFDNIFDFFVELLAFLEGVNGYHFGLHFLEFFYLGFESSDNFESA